MPNDNTHTGIDDVLRVLNSRNANGEIEYGAYSELHDMISALSRTPAEPKAGDWGKELEDDHVYDVYATDPQSTSGWYRALYSQGEGFLIGEHPNARILSDVKIVRALSSAAPRITEGQFREQVEYALEGGVIDDPGAIRSTVDRIMSALPAPLSGITGDSDKSDLPIANSVQLSEEMVERVVMDALAVDADRHFGWEATMYRGSRIVELIRAALRQQGAERKWISVDNLRHTEGRLLILELLRRQGYAKGGYFNTCKSCGKEAWWMDKRAWTCLECAQHNVNDLLYSITNDPSEQPPFTPTQTEE